MVNLQSNNPGSVKLVVCGLLGVYLFSSSSIIHPNYSYKERKLLRLDPAGCSISRRDGIGSTGLRLQGPGLVWALTCCGTVDMFPLFHHLTFLTQKRKNQTRLKILLHVLDSLLPDTL